MNYDELLAPAAKAMRPSGIRKFFDLAADMPHCISLGVGEPDFKTPWSVRDAGIRSLELGRTKYTANSGLKELRGEICNYLQRRFDLHYKEENILVTVGGSEAIDLTIRAVVQPGDEVIIPEPCFVCYEPITQLTGGVPVHIATRAEDQFRLTADQLRAAITPRTKLLIFPYPNNPTGAVMSAAEMEEIAAVLRETNVLVLSDEIYSELTYGLDRHVSIASLPGMAERTIVVNGFSKSYAMTGWRLGYAAGPAPLVKVMTKIHQSCMQDLSAGFDVEVTGFDQHEVDALVASFAESGHEYELPGSEPYINNFFDSGVQAKPKAEEPAAAPAPEAPAQDAEMHPNAAPAPNEVQAVQPGGKKTVIVPDLSEQDATTLVDVLKDMGFAYRLEDAA